MPSRFRLRDKLGIRSKSSSATRPGNPAISQSSLLQPVAINSGASASAPNVALNPAPATHVAPPLVTNIAPQTDPAPNIIPPAVVPSLVPQTGPAPNIIPPAVTPTLVLQPDPATSVVIVPNPAFQQAVANLIKDLSPAEQQAFNRGNDLSIESLMSQINLFDETHHQTSRSRRCADRIQQFLTALQGYMKGLAPFLQQVEPISSLIIGGANVIIDLGLRFAEFFEKLTDMMSILGGHLVYLSKYATGFMESREVQQALTCAYGDILQFFQGARKVFTDKQGKESNWTSFRVFFRVSWEPFEARFGAINLQFREHVDIVIRTANIVQYERVWSKEISQKLQDEDKERRDILHWMSKLDFEDDHETFFSKRYGDTGSWLIESQAFTDWLDADKSSVLWCYGRPGAGKSVLASLIVDTISAQYALDDRAGLGFMYYKYQNREAQKFKDIIPALVKQLCQKKHVLATEVKELYRQYSRQDQFLSQAKCQALLMEVSESFEQVFIVIDALDECVDQDVVLPLIAALIQSSSTKIKICITSRRQQFILHSLAKLKCPTIEIEAKKVDQDIAVFVSAEIDRRSEDYIYDIISPELRILIKAALVGESNGMFLWISYQIDHIFGQPSLHHIIDSLKSLPSDMASTYTRIVQKINEQVPAMKVLAKRALLWVICAGRPLSLEELVIAVAIELDLENTTDLKACKGEAIIGACANFITVENGIVVPVHHTVQEFLTAQSSFAGLERTFVQEY
ncbi:hypothetical protein Q9L58_009170 [Maublancomyces gigas]|uniref:NACHT domain-containing protein n=1 Tax=Discina gigas TaxID=1032678 RepID=A0ABR3G7N9_9PEZI